MRNYTSLHITVSDRGVAEKFEESLDEIQNISIDGWVTYDVEIYKENPSYLYKFDHGLTKNEIVGLTKKLIDLGVKSFSFENTDSLHRDD